MPTSADTLLRLARPAPRPEPPVPRALGVDEWAWRKGRRYGTILVDLERKTVVDLLPDRDAGSFAAWLRDHPGVEVVARDRADVYADGARQGAPRAVHVADRWHLLRNLGEAVRTAVGAHHAAVRRARRGSVAERAGPERAASTPAGGGGRGARHEPLQAPLRGGPPAERRRRDGQRHRAGLRARPQARAQVAARGRTRHVGPVGGPRNP